MSKRELETGDPVTPTRDTGANSTRYVYTQPRLSYFGSLTELTKGGGYTGTDHPGTPFINKP